MASKNKDEILSKFIAITQCDSDEALGYLEAAKWNEQTAVDIFFDTGASPARGSGSSTRPKPSSTNTSRTVPGKPTPSEGDAYESDDDLLQSALEESLRFKPPEKPAAIVSKKTNDDKPTVSSKINTVHTVRQNKTHTDNDQGQAFYAGGSENSGQQIIGPRKGKDNDNKVTDVFEAARQHEVKESQDDKSASSSSHTKKEKPFAGVGRSLGNDNVPSRTQRQPAAVAAAAAGPNKIENLPIRFYSNGFTVGDGELRQFDDNKEFMDCIKRNEIPPELRNLNKDGRQVQVSLEDHRSEEYKRIVPEFKPFGGTGYTIGLSGSGQNPLKSPVAASNNSTSGPLDTNRLEQLAEKRLKTSSTSTTIRLRLPDVSAPVRIQIDLNRTLADVRKFLNENIPSLQSVTYEFMEPPSTKIKQADEKRKISDAKLSNTTLVVRRIT